MGRSVDIPNGMGSAELARRVKDLGNRIIDAKHIIGMTRMRLKEYLREMQKVCLRKENDSVNSMSLLEVYRLFLQKEKILYSTLNKFKKEEKLYLGFCWIPRNDNKTILG